MAKYLYLISYILDVQVQRLEHDHEPGTSPGHYQQP